MADVHCFFPIAVGEAFDNFGKRRFVDFPDEVAVEAARVGKRIDEHHGGADVADGNRGTACRFFDFLEAATGYEKLLHGAAVELVEAIASPYLSHARLRRPFGCLLAESSDHAFDELAYQVVCKGFFSGFFQVVVFPDAIPVFVEHVVAPLVAIGELLVSFPFFPRVAHGIPCMSCLFH